MTEVLFYHLTNSPLEQTLPVLVAKSRERDWRVVIRAGSEERLQAIDSLLWTYDESSFLPHGLASEPDPAGQPILLTTEDERPNNADVLILIDQAGLPREWPYVRVVLLFDDADKDAVEAARGCWKTVKDLGHDASYWQQDESGRWVKKR